MIDRRTFLGATASGALASLTRSKPARADNKPAGVTFSFGTYGMKSMKTEDAIRTVAEVGYDGIELAVRPDWDCAPARMPKPRRETMRLQLADAGLRVTALMEHLYPEQDDDKHKLALDRLLGVAELGYELSPDNRPLIQTVLGGGTWEEKKHFFADRLGDWAETAKQAETVIAIKPHRGGGMSQPSEAAWLIQQLGNTQWIRMVYDYSHYAFRDMSVEATVETALPFTAHIAIKDAVKTETGFRFVLPGQSKSFDYAKLFQLFHAGGYRGDICCEVSGMVWGQKEYDPIVAAKACYANIAPVFTEAKVPRRGAN